MDSLKFAGFSCLILLVFSNISASTGDEISQALAGFTGCQEPQIPEDVIPVCRTLVSERKFIVESLSGPVGACSFLLETQKKCLEKLQKLNCTSNATKNALTVANLLGQPDLRMCDIFGEKFLNTSLDLEVPCDRFNWALHENVTKCLESKLSPQPINNISVCALGADNYVKCTEVISHSEKCIKQNKKMKILFSSVNGIVNETFNLICSPDYGKGDNSKKCSEPDIIAKIKQCFKGFLDDFPYVTKSSCNQFKKKVECARKAADECAFGPTFRKFTTGFIDASCNSAHGIITSGFQVLLAVFASVLMWLLNVKSSF